MQLEVLLVSSISLFRVKYLEGQHEKKKTDGNLLISLTLASRMPLFLHDENVEWLDDSFNIRVRFTIVHCPM